MIIGIGFDVVEVDRMDSWLSDSKLIERYFHPEELTDMDKQNKMKAQSLAVRFAAKEAFGKALGTGISDFALTDVRIISADNGKPCFSLHGKAAELMEDRGGKKAFLSLSHEKTYAGAVVVIEA